jgi:hypothetical protein
MKIVTALTIAGVLSACGGAPPQPTVPGVYGFLSTPIVDTCTPKRAAPQAASDVSIVGDAVSVMIPDGPQGALALVRFEIPPGGVHSVRRLSLQACGSETLTRDIDVVSYGNPLIISVRERHGDVEPGTGNCVSEVPASDCESEHDITYSLIEECRAPCSVRQAQPFVLRCECPDAG